MSEIIGSILKDNEKNQITTSMLGEFGEKAALVFLKKHDYHLVASNFTIPVGRNRKGVAVKGEIDLIAFDKDTLCFIEVKTRSSELFATALSAVDIRKQRQITRTARIYRKTFNIKKIKFRFDVVKVITQDKKAPKIELIKAFWNKNKFKKKSWLDKTF